MLYSRIERKKKLEWFQIPIYKKKFQEIINFMDRMKNKYELVYNIAQ